MKIPLVIAGQFGPSARRCDTRPRSAAGQVRQL
jgi:hypothetical protein